MRRSKILSKLRAGEPVRLAMMGHFLPPFVAYAAHQGFDGIWLDLEHRAFDPREVQALLAYFHLFDIDSLIRPATREKALLYRYLEDGAAGLVIPHVSDVETARALVQAVKFPPLGDRGLEGRGLEASFGLDTHSTRDALVEHALHETFLLVQIETPQGLAQADSIAAIPGVDGLYVGPADLSLRLQHLPDHDRPGLDDALKQVATVCQHHGKPWGSLPRSVDEMRRHVTLGATILMWGIDVRMIEDGLTQARHDMDTIIGGAP